MESKNNKKKSNESECFRKVLKCPVNKGNTAFSIHQILLDSECNTIFDRESPDIVINNETEIIGIEHFRVDMLFKMKKRKAHSLIGIQNTKCEDLVDKYKNDELLEEDIDNGTAIRSVLEMVEERNRFRNRFNYQEFIKSLREISKGHNQKSEKYRENLNVVADGKRCTLAALIEIPYYYESAYKIFDLKGIRKQAIKGVPITSDMLSAIRDMNGFDFVILCMHCIDKPNNKKGIVCYYFIPKNMTLGIREQMIKPIRSFDLVNKHEIDFPKDKIVKNENGDISFVTRVKPIGKWE